MRLRPIAAILLCAACGGADGDPEVFGADIRVSSTSAPYAQAPDFRHRMGRVLAMSAEHWDFDPARFAGLRIVVTGERVACPGIVLPELGCYLDSERTILLSTDSSNCIERSPLAHEILHYVLDLTTGYMDAAHHDSRWADLDASLYPQLAEGGKLFCSTP